MLILSQFHIFPLMVQVRIGGEEADPRSVLRGNFTPYTQPELPIRQTTQRFQYDRTLSWILNRYMMWGGDTHTAIHKTESPKHTLVVLITAYRSKTFRNGKQTFLIRPIEVGSFLFASSEYDP